MNQSATSHESDFCSPICRLLVDESSVYITSFIQYLNEKNRESSFPSFVQCASHECSHCVLDRLYAYLKLVGDSGPLRTILNDPKLPVPFLEKYVLYLMGKDLLSIGHADSVIDNHLSFLENNRLLDLLLRTEYLSKDYSFVTQALSRFTNRDVDTLLAMNPEFRPMIMALFFKMPPDLIYRMILRIPVMYDYVLLFFELEGRMEELEQIQMQWSDTSKTAGQIHEILAILNKIDLHVKGYSSVERGALVSMLATLILSTENPEVVFSNLEYASDFSDPNLRALLRSIIQSDETRKQLDFKVGNYNIEDIHEFIINCNRSTEHSTNGTV